MSDAAMLRKLLEAENSSRSLIKEAEEAAGKRVHEETSRLQEEFRVRREEKLREIAAEEEKFFSELEERQRTRMAAFEEDLKTVEVSFADADTELKRILGLS